MLKIIPGYLAQANYVKAARAQSGSDLQQLWWTHAIAPYWADWAQGQFNEERTRAQMQAPILCLDELELAIELISQSGVAQWVAQAYAEMTRVLPSPLEEHVVCIYAADPTNDWILQNGVLGSGLGDNTLLQINPLHPNWQEWVGYVLAHEYHHAIWGYHYFYLRGQMRMDLLTGLMVDGQADSFAHMLYPQLKPSWLDALTLEQEAVQWGRMQAHLTSEDGEIYSRFFFGDEQSGTPVCTAYTLGYHIVQTYLQGHPGINVIDLLEMPPQDILAGSGFTPEGERKTTP